MDSTSLSVVIPCYNEYDGMGELYKRVTAVLAQITDGYEIVLVDDGSKDKTWLAMTMLAGEDHHVKAVKLSRNHGHQLALSAGLFIAKGNRILILDADLQDPPELLPEMIKMMDAGADVVYGQRTLRHGESWFKRITASAFYNIIDRLSESPIPRDTGDFRLISRRVLNVLLEMPERHRFIRGMISWVGYRQEPLQYERQARFAGETKYPLHKMTRFAIDALTAFSIKPLQFASLIGIIFAFVGLLLVAFTIVSYIFFHSVAGWASVMAAMSIMGSVQLLMLGIVGEYLGRLYEQTKSRPLFIIDQVLNNEQNISRNSNLK